MHPKIYARSEHPISRNSIDPDALKVLYRLYRAGHTAYLVGGGVRDLLVNRNPKDFDIVTSARPAQVRKLFRNCRLIGRRFRLAHIHFPSGKIIELATFRGKPAISSDPDSEDKLVVSDNCFGNPQQDAERRDFTINSLFYDIATFSLIDYAGAMQDVQSKIVRTIGDPALRFQEDPVRMIRAIKFAARLDFEFEPTTWQAIVEVAPSINRAARPRVVEEMARLLEEGSAERSMELLYSSGLLAEIEPVLNDYLVRAQHDEVHHDPDGATLFRLLRAADQMSARGIKLPRPLLLCLWAFPVLDEIDYIVAQDPERTAWNCLWGSLGTLGHARRELETSVDILMAFRKLLLSRKRKAGKKATPQMECFSEALLLLDMWVEATGEGAEDLERWSANRSDAEKRFTTRKLEAPRPQIVEKVRPDSDPGARRKLRRRPPQGAGKVNHGF
jgi:poly(A) polymerase